MSKKKVNFINSEKDSDWEDIFNDIEMTFLPIEYVSRIVIKFENNVKWDIDVDDSRKKQPLEQIEDALDELFDEYEDQIETIDFRLDLERIKTDLSRRVYRFLKLNR